MSSFFKQKESTSSEATDLAIKEMLLGVIRSKDKSHAGVLHASDFRTAVAHLGIPMGHAVVEEILMHCSVSADDGSIDFSALQAELAMQRKTLNERMQREKREKQVFHQSSVAAVGSNPFAKRDEHATRIKTDKFALLLAEYRPEVTEIFRDFSNHQLTPQEVRQHLGAYGINPSRRFQMVLEDHRSGEDLSFRDFYSALAAYDPNETLASATRAAGQCMNDTGKFSLNAHEKSDSERLFQKQTKRTHIMAQKLQQDRSNAEGLDGGARRKEKIFEDQNPSGDAALYKDSSRIVSALKPDKNDPSMMLTHNKAQMIQGVSGGSSVIKYNVEQKLTREQVLAALRRLDSSAINVHEFERKMYEIGIDIDPLLLKKIRDTLKTGKLDYKGVVSALDSQVFLPKALNSAPKPEEMAEIKRKVSACLKEKAGTNGLNSLYSLFHRIDDNKNGLLSYNEFTKACSVIGLSETLSLKELRMLFHEMDTNGDGGLDIREFTHGMRGPIRGVRLKVLRNAYSKADTVNTNEVTLDYMMALMQMQYHPDVVSGLNTVRQAQTDFINFMTAANPGDEEVADQPITFELFTEYWGNVSFFIEEDSAFLTLLSKVMGTSELAPAPPIVLARRTAEGKGTEAASKAVQVHGDIVAWGQEASAIERSARSTARLYKRAADENSSGASSLRVFGSSPNLFKHATVEATRDYQTKKTNFDTHTETSNIFSWDTSKKGAYKAKQRAQEQWQRKMEINSADAGGASEKIGARVGTFQIDEVEPIAGSSSEQAAKKRNQRGIVSKAAQNNFGRPSPFATDLDNEREEVLSKRMMQADVEAKPTPAPRALSELLKEKKSSSGPRSLQDIIDAKAKESA